MRLLCGASFCVVPVVTQVRPGTENEEDIEEKIQTVVCSDVRPGASPARTRPGRTRGVVAEADPEASLIINRLPDCY